MDEFVPPAALPSGGAPAYEADRHGWALRRTELLRAGQLAEVDAPSVAEELIDVAGAECDGLESARRVLLTHLLKWDHQPARRSRSWEATIREQRNRIPRLPRKNPGLEFRLDEAVGDAWEEARVVASGETGLRQGAFPVDRPYGWADIMDRAFVLGD